MDIHKNFLTSLATSEETHKKIQIKIMFLKFKMKEHMNTNHEELIEVIKREVGLL